MDSPANKDLPANNAVTPQPGETVAAGTPPRVAAPAKPALPPVAKTPNTPVGAVVESTPDSPVNKMRRRIVWASVTGFLATSFLMFLRFFLDRICTHMLAFEGDAHVEWFEGNFEDYEADKIRRLGPDAVEPKRIKYKKFTR